MNPFTEAGRTAGIPTLYNGIRFRSRLEATWAAFFDGLGWRWEYEPFDCAGWIPDFALANRFGAARPVLVEVKPTFSFDRGAADKITRADKEHEVLLLGVAPLIGADDREGHFLGWFRDSWHFSPITDAVTGAETGEILGPDEWHRAALGRWRSDNPGGVVGFCHEYNAYFDRITGSYDGGHYGGGVDGDELRGLWAAAKNTVQWRGVRAA